MKQNNNNNNNSIKNKSRPKTGNRLKKNNKFFENNKKYEKNPFKDNSFDNTNYNKKPSNNMIINNINNNNQNEEYNIKPIAIQSKFSNETNTNTAGTGIISNSSNNQNKFKGKKSNNFVNEKMIIKPDPNKSIFKAVPNSAFFNQGNQKNTDIVIMAKKRPEKINKNDMIIKEEKNEINENKEIKTKTKEDLRYKNMFDNEDINNNIKKNNEIIEEENIIIKDKNDNIMNNIIDYDNNREIKNYKKEKKLEKGTDKNIIQKLLDQMDFLTKGQKSLEKMFNNIQLDTQEQIENLNINYENLQSKTNKLYQNFDNYNLNIY